MKTNLAILTLVLSSSHLFAAEATVESELAKIEAAKKKISPEEVVKKHAKGSSNAAIDQDELSADVQDLIQEQTDGKVIELLEKAEELMAEATDNLDVRNTGGETIAIETEIIERIYEAAKQKKKSKQGEGEPQPGDGMMEMLEQMMGKKPGEGDQPGKKPGDKAGEGQEGLSDKANDASANGANEGNTITRRIPKSSGTAGSSLPRELQNALNAFNKAAAEKR